MGKYFGTDGVRGRAGDVLTAEMAYRIGRYIGAYKGHRKILLGRDTRLSGPMLSSALVSGILASGSDVYDLGVTTTPSISYLVSRFDFAHGIMVSASHNPFYDNGIKVFEENGEKLSSAIEDEIEAYMVKEEDDLPLATREKIGLYANGASLKEKYVAWLRSMAPKAQDISLLVDLSNGSASEIVPGLLENLGYKATYINGKPDGTNINRDCGATHLEGLKEEFAKGGYDLAFSYDGDSDRFMGLDPKGRLVDGDAAIYLLALALRKEGRLKKDKAVLTVMSNFGLRKALEEKDIAYEIVPVGDKYVQACLKKEGLSVGGEQSGHVIVYDYLNTGDGILTSLLILKIFVEYPEIFAKLDDFRVYPQKLENVSFETRKDLEGALSSPKLQEAIKKAEEMLGRDGRLLVRPSGTENLLRVMAEHPDSSICYKAVETVLASIKEQ